MDDRVERLCPLCIRQARTRQYHEDQLIWIVDCEICCVPMAVLKRHTRNPTEEERQHIASQLLSIAQSLPEEEWYLDDTMRRIPDHYHAHLRPRWWL